MNASAQILAISLAFCAAPVGVGVRIASAQQPAENRTVLLTNDLKGIEGQKFGCGGPTSLPVWSEQNIITPARSAFMCSTARSIWRKWGNDGPPPGRRGALRTA